MNTTHQITNILFDNFTSIDQYFDIPFITDLINSNNLIIDHCNFTNNQGVIFGSESSVLSISNCEFNFNSFDTAISLSDSILNVFFLNLI